MRRPQAIALATAPIWLAMMGWACAEDTTSATPSAAGGTKLTGVFQLHVVLTVSPDIPNGTSVSIAPNASVSDATYTNSADAFTSATVAGGKVNFVVDIPYTWQVVSRSEQVTISVSAFTNASNAAFSFSDNSYFSKSLKLPANGATTKVLFSGSI